MTAIARGSNARHALYLALEPSVHPEGGLSPLNKLVCAFILLSAAVAVVETEPVIVAGRETWFAALEWFFTAVFAVEYAARMWVSVEDPRYGPGLKGRIRFALSPAAIVDLIAITPAFLTFVDAEAYLLRLVRLIRIFRLARLGRFSRAIQDLAHAVSSRQYELLISIGFAFVLMLAASTCLYIVEGPVQPDQFGSILRAMWWAVVTLTTVGYGDVYPITALGRFFAAITAVLGIAVVAVPTGILASGFSEAIKRRRHDAAHHEIAQKDGGRSS